MQIPELGSRGAYLQEGGRDKGLEGVYRNDQGVSSEVYMFRETTKGERIQNIFFDYQDVTSQTMLSLKP